MRRAVATAAIVGSALAAGASAAPGDGDRIRHGAGIGKVRLGMTYAEVRRILGAPQTVDAREQLAGGRRYLEFSWDFGWWTVGFMGRPGKMRVASVQTLSRRERTVDGLGVGTRESVLHRELGRMRCSKVAPRDRYYWSFEHRCAYASHPGRETAFVLGLPPGPPWYWTPKDLVVTAVRVHLRNADYCFRGSYVCRPVP